MSQESVAIAKLAPRTHKRMPCFIASYCRAWLICGHGVCRRHRICFGPKPACFAGEPPWFVEERGHLYKALRARLGADRP